jgi:hypothetical protein
MGSDLVKKLGELVKKKSKISIKNASSSLKSKEAEIASAAMKLSDEFSVTKNNNKISFITYIKMPNSKEIVLELTKLIKKIKDSEFKEIKKVLLSCIMFLEKNQHIDNADKAKKAVADYSKELEIYIKSFNEMKGLEKKSCYYSELVKQYSKKIDDDTKIMQEHSKSLNLSLESMRKSFESIKKQKRQNNNSAQKLQELIFGGKIRHKSIIELLGIKKMMPEKKESLKNNEKKDETESIKEHGMGSKESAQAKKENSAIKMSGEFSTEIDQLLKLAKEEATVSFAKLAKLYEEKTETIEEWCEALEEIGLISIHYPLIGSPYIKYKKKSED